VTSVPDRLRWHDDMLVTPLHLDQLARRLEALVQHVPTRNGRFAWGIVSSRVTVDEGRLAVGSVEAIMPNGLYVASTDEAQDLRVDLPSHAPPQGECVRVYLAVALDDSDREAMSPPHVVADPGAAGWIGDDGLPLERVRTRVALVVGSPPAPERFTSLPLAEVRIDGRGGSLTDFVPPLVAVGPDHPLVAQCAAVAGQLRREVDVLATRSIDNAPLPFRAEIRAQINPMLAALPPFEVMFGAHPHPFALYLELCRVAAAVAALRDRVTPPTFPAYVHEDPRASFDPVFRFVSGAAAPRLTETTASFPFERDGAWFRLPPAQPWSEALASESPSQLVLAMQADTTEALAAQWGEQAVIASRGVIQSLLARRVLGLARHRVHAVGGLPVERDVFLFLLDRQPQIARPGEDLLVLGDLPALKPDALTLHVVREGGR